MKKHAPNTAARGELGWFPIAICIAQQVVKYWSMLHSNQNKLAHSALLKNMQSTQDSWSKTVESLVAQIETSSYTPAPKSNPAAMGRLVESCLRQQHLDHVGSRLGEAIGTDSRLSFYGQLAAGKEYQIEPYLTFGLPLKTTRPITRMRTGCHHLPIATGRLHTPPLNLQDTTCTHIGRAHV